MQNPGGYYYFPQQPQHTPYPSNNQQQQLPLPPPHAYDPHSAQSFYPTPAAGPAPLSQEAPLQLQPSQQLTPDVPVGDFDEDDEEGGTPEAGTKKKGGRPRDKVWEHFEGDRSVAKCVYCGWKTDHPKAFRMRTHVSTCVNVPQEAKEEMAQYQAEKEQKRAVKAEVAADALGQTGSPSTAASRPPPAKKVKRTATGEPAPSSRPRMAPPPPALPTPPPPPKRSPITCHVLDSTSGKPAPEMRIRLDRLNTTGFVLQAQGITDNDGRCGNLLPPGTAIEVGIFKITFFTNEYFTKRGILSFYPFIEIPFEVKSAEEHYHIPCLLSPYSYTTYRGS